MQLHVGAAGEGLVVAQCGSCFQSTFRQASFLFFFGKQKVLYCVEQERGSTGTQRLLVCFAKCHPLHRWISQSIGALSQNRMKSRSKHKHFLSDNASIPTPSVFSFGQAPSLGQCSLYCLADKLNHTNTPATQPGRRRPGRGHANTRAERFGKII